MSGAPLLTTHHKTRHGFTLVELIIVIVVIAILAGIVTLGLSRYQQHSRDNQRATKINVIAESLEAYYDKNGEYPTCAMMTANPNGILANTTPELFVSPNAASGTTNSFMCGGLTGSENGTKFGYVAGGCNQASCTTFSLQYQEEETGDIKNVASRRS